MRIHEIEVFVFKYNHHYRVGGHREAPNRLLGTDYYFEPQWKQVYSRLTESCLVKITTDSGLMGWGEAQSPVVPEVTAKLIEKLVGPALLGKDPTDTESIYDHLYHLNKVRGHTASFTLDAMAAVDLALWDIKGKEQEKPVHALLGTQAAQPLPLYVSGLRRSIAEERCELAKQVVREGYAGVKIFCGGTAREILEECQRIRAAMNGGYFAFDAIGGLDWNTAVAVGEGLDNIDTLWFEAPVDAEDVEAHALLAKQFSTPIAAGEHLRSVREFKPWVEKEAIQILQPDVVRCGITGARRIVQLQKDGDFFLTPHIGVCTGIGVAATWQFAAAFRPFVMQEHQLDMFEVSNRVLHSPLQVQEGKAVVPSAPGLGIAVNEAFIRAHSAVVRIGSETQKQ